MNGIALGSGRTVAQDRQQGTAVLGLVPRVTPSVHLGLVLCSYYAVSSALLNFRLAFKWKDIFGRALHEDAIMEHLDTPSTSTLCHPVSPYYMSVCEIRWRPFTSSDSPPLPLVPQVTHCLRRRGSTTSRTRRSFCTLIGYITC